MVKIRLKRMGAHKRPCYRIVVADSRCARDGKFIEEIGFFDPIADPEEIRIDGDRAKEWMSKGAQPTERVRSLMKKTGVI